MFLEVRYFGGDPGLNLQIMASNSPSLSDSHSHKIKNPCATVSRPGSSTPIVITSFAMKDYADFHCTDSADSGAPAVQMLCPLELEVIIDKLKECDAIRYAAYRTATKLDVLRTALRLDQVKLGAVTSAFHQHGVKSPLTDLQFSASKLTDVIADIFFSAGKVSSFC